jgi:uncharacterized membrane protein
MLMNGKCSTFRQLIMTNGSVVCAGLCALGIAFAASAGERPSRFITFEAPGAGSTAGSYQGTGCFAYPSCSVIINNLAAVTGYYLDSNNVYHGFLRSPYGTITTFEAPGADTTPGSFNGTLPYAINDAGVITGFYSDATGATHGFLRDSSGAFTTFDVPDGSLITIPVALNVEGSIVGSVLDKNSVWRAFVRSPEGSFATFAGPGACHTSPGNGCTGTGAQSINASGKIAGGFSDSDAVLHGLVRGPEGKVTAFDAPGAGAVPGSYQGTSCLDCSAPVNQSGTVAGYYIDSSNVVHGFLRSAEGKITTFDAPAEAGSQGFGCFVDCALGFSDWGWVTGTYLDANSVNHGFIRSPDGEITSFDAPGADKTSGSYHGTFPVSINDEGLIAGYYVDVNSVNHAFVRLPQPQ